MFRSVFIISALLAPSLAGAQCPTQSDLATGIKITYNATDHEVFTAGSDGNIIEIGTKRQYGEQIEWVITQFAGAFETQVMEREVGKWHKTAQFDLVYDFDLASNLPLAAGAIIGGTQTLEEPGISDPATFSYSVHAREDVTIGNCSFAALEIYQSLFLADGDLGLFRMVYMPELGFGYKTEGFWANGDAYSRQAQSIEIAG